MAFPQFSRLFHLIKKTKTLQPIDGRLKASSNCPLKGHLLERPATGRLIKYSFASVQRYE
jgi:hypothetical protein